MPPKKPFLALPTSNQEPTLSVRKRPENLTRSSQSSQSFKDFFALFAFFAAKNISTENKATNGSGFWQTRGSADWVCAFAPRQRGLGVRLRTAAAQIGSGAMPRRLRQPRSSGSEGEFCERDFSNTSKVARGRATSLGGFRLRRFDIHASNF